MKAILFSLVLGWVVPLFNLKNTPVTSVSFHLVRNLIIVQASANEKEGYFIVDTGVSEIILNNRYFDGRPTSEKFYGVNGIEIDKEISFIKFNLGGFEKKVIATVTDFTALEKIAGIELLGVVGNGVFKDCELVLDYTFKEITIYQLNKDGNRLSSKSIHQKPQVTLPIFVARGLPFLEVNAKGKQLKMILDTGASANVIDSREIDHINTSLFRVGVDSMASFGQDIIAVKSLKVNELKVGMLNCPPMKTVFFPLNQLNQNQWGITIDGILGFEFLSNFRVAINFRKREISLWDRESVEQQWAIAKNNEVIKPNVGIEIPVIDN
ncbi:MAG TPA: retropepsin-like aspartic protease [Algoriphagus sp.]|nr:retropepsin-like aspartic protease [Algoriphagus sp.]